MIDEALETEPLRGSAPPPEHSSEEDTATTQPSSNIDQPPMPRVHNDETTQTDLNCDEQTTSTQNTAAEKPLDHAYVVVPSPPETVDQPFLPSPDILATH
jgi:hypothetical protein